MRILPATYVRTIGDVARTSRALTRAGEFFGKLDPPHPDDNDMIRATYGNARGDLHHFIGEMRDALDRLENAIDSGE